MTEETAAPTEPQAHRRRARRWLIASGLVLLALAGWWLGVELPERRAAAELKRQQAENARSIPDLSLDLVWLPPGTFLMGTPERNKLATWFYNLREKLTRQPSPGDAAHPNERPAMWVTLTRPFWLGRTEVTQAQWTAVMGSNPSAYKGESLPVEYVSWDEAMEFCRKLPEREQAAGRLPKGHAYTLPTEAQWEYACRAGTTGDYAGNLDAMAWYGANSGGTPHPVGTKQANAWGLHDMHGNVWEWCANWFDDYRGGEVTNPKGPSSGSSRVDRGGGRFNAAARARSASRFGAPPFDRLSDLGFRLALSPQVSQPPAGGK